MCRGKCGTRVRSGLLPACHTMRSTPSCPAPCSCRTCALARRPPSADTCSTSPRMRCTAGPRPSTRHSTRSAGYRPLSSGSASPRTSCRRSDRQASRGLWPPRTALRAVRQGVQSGSRRCKGQHAGARRGGGAWEISMREGAAAGDQMNPSMARLTGRRRPSYRQEILMSRRRYLPQRGLPWRIVRGVQEGDPHRRVVLRMRACRLRS